MADRKPILSLDTLVERAVVAIDGQAYELRNAGEFSLLEGVQLEKRGQRLKQLFAGDGEPSEEDVAALEADLEWVCRKVLLAPADILCRMTSNHRLAVVMAFIELLRGKTAPPAGVETTTAPTESQSTGVDSSPS
jgi:hypothetical protein